MDYQLVQIKLTSLALVLYTQILLCLGIINTLCFPPDNQNEIIFMKQIFFC